MIITTKYTLPITVYRTSNGEEKRETIYLKPGSRNYPLVNHKDPRVAEQLRIMRKHGRIVFDELLQSDLELLKEISGTPEEKAKALVVATTLGPAQPIVKVVTPATAKAPAVKTPKKGGKQNAQRTRKAPVVTEEPQKEESPDQSDWPLPGEVEN